MKRVHPLFAMAVVIIAIAAIALPESRMVEKATEPTRLVWDGKACLKCHNDVETIEKMRLKDPDPHYLDAELASAKKAGRWKYEPTTTDSSDTTEVKKAHNQM